MPTAYEGNEPYIFVSYSHKDKDEVLRYVEALEKSGFRVWFDGGVEVGSEWPEYIANHLAESACVMAFVSKNFVDSENCRRELTLSQELKKGQLNIYIKHTTKEDLPMGMRLQLGLNQALFRENFDSDHAFLAELSKAKLIEGCRRKKQPESTPKTVSYKGDKPYIFVNYSHKDQEEVLRYVAALQERGFRVWLDTGVSESEDWIQSFTDRIKKSACVLSFISHDFAKSVWCQKELNYANASNKAQVAVYIQNTKPEDLPAGMRLQLGLTQGLFRENFDSDAALIRQLCKAEMLAPCREGIPQEEQKENAEEQEPSLLKKLHQIVNDDEETEEEERERTPLEKEYAKKSARLGWLGVILEILWLPLTGHLLQEMVLRQLGAFWLILNLTVLHTIVFLINKIFFTVLAKRMKRKDLDLQLLEGPKVAIWAVCVVCSVIAIFVGAGKIYTAVNYFTRLLISLGLYLIPVAIPFFGYLFLDE